MPKISVVDANLTAEERKTLQCERDLAEVLRALGAQDVEKAARAYAVAIERGGDGFLACCQCLPVKWQRMIADVAKVAAKGDKPRR